MSEDLEKVLTQKLSEESITCEILNLEPLTGGASKEIWKFLDFSRIPDFCGSAPLRSAREMSGKIPGEFYTFPGNVQETSILEKF